MKLLVTVIEDDDTPALMGALTQQGFQATKLASTGGFLLQGNTTLLIGVEDEKVDAVISVIKSVCVRRKKLLAHATSELPTAINVPIEIEAGGAIVFVVKISDFFRL